MGIIKTATRCFDKIYNCILFSLKGIKLQQAIEINGRIILCGFKKANVVLGKGIHINSSMRSNPSGGGTEHTMITVFPGASLSIGDNVGISNSTIVCRESVTIGNNVDIGVNNVIYDNDMHSVGFLNRMERPDLHIKTAPVVIDDGAWICGHCIILKGVHIGKRSVVAAGSVVTHDVPDDELWGGNPCRFIRKINQRAFK